MTTMECYFLEKFNSDFSATGMFGERRGTGWYLDMAKRH